MSSRLTHWSVLWAVVVTGWVNTVQAGPLFPWRPRSLGPAPYTQRQALPPQPRIRPATPQPAAIRSQSWKPEQGQPSEPTPLNVAPAPQTRTYFSARRPDSLFPSGHGIHVAVSQKFLDELIRVESQEAGPVRDCILGAQVIGSQQTETSLHVRLIPNDNQAELEFQLSGTTRNSTENRTPQAVIQSEGMHRFEVSKSVQFDGNRIQTRSPSAVMFPRQQNNAALTPASAIPILGPLVSEYALGVAEQRRPAAERITAERITGQVVPKFNDAIDKRLASLNTQWLEVLPKQLPQFGIITPTTRVQTTDQQMTVSFAWDAVLNCPEYVPPAGNEDVAGLRLAVHSEAVNVWLASLPLGGLEIPVNDLDQWQSELERLLSSSEWGRPQGDSQAVMIRVNRVRVQAVSDERAQLPGLGAPTILGPLLLPSGRVDSEQVEKVPTIAEPVIEPVAGSPSPREEVELIGQSQMVLAPENPISVEFGSGEAVVTLVAAFRLAPAPQTEFHRIRIPLRSQLLDQELALTPGTVQVEAATASPGPLGELVRSTIEKQVQQRLKTTLWPVKRLLARDQGSPMVLQMRDLSSDSGWLSLAWEVENPAQAQSSSVITPAPASIFAK